MASIILGTLSSLTNNKIGKKNRRDNINGAIRIPMIELHPLSQETTAVEECVTLPDMFAE